MVDQTELGIVIYTHRYGFRYVLRQGVRASRNERDPPSLRNKGIHETNLSPPSFIEVSDVSGTLQVEEWPSSSITLEDQTMG